MEPDTGLVTACDLGSGVASDASVAPGLIDGDPEAETILGDSAYGSGELRAHLEDEDEDKTAVIDPPPLRTAIAGGFSLDDFDIDIDARTVTCPAGVTVGLNKHDQARFGGCWPARAAWPAAKPSPSNTANTGPWSNGPSRHGRQGGLL